MDIMDGKEYPQADEYDGFIKLINYMKDNYTFVSPMNKNANNIDNFKHCNHIIFKQS